MEESNSFTALNVWSGDDKNLSPTSKGITLEVINQIATLFAAGTYYYYILNIENLEINYVHEGIKKVLGIEPKDFSLHKLYEVIHPADLDMIRMIEQAADTFLHNTIPQDEIPLYKVVYLMRLQHLNGRYRTILQQAKATIVSEEGKIQQAIVVHTDISHLNAPYDHKISFISNKRPSYYSMIPDSSLELIKGSLKNILSVREKEIIKKIAEGKSLFEIADLLFLSPYTVNTHKKNILRKSHCKNTTELIACCLHEGII